MNSISQKFIPASAFILSNVLWSARPEPNIENKEIVRAAVGRIANVGDLYNARTDSFSGVSVFKKSPPPAAIRITDNPFSDIQYVRSETFSEKFEKLDIKADLQVSILVGLLKLEGHGKYLSDEKKGARAVRSSLLYNIKTKVKRLENGEYSIEKVRDIINSYQNIVEKYSIEKVRDIINSYQNIIEKYSIEIVRDIINSYQNIVEKYSIEKVRDIINSYQNIIEKITSADILKKEGVTYIVSGDEGDEVSIDEKKWKNLNKNVVIFGETGSGKSSVVNLLLGRKAAHVSDGARGCTLHFDSYAHKGYNFYDTAGFSEGSGGAVDYEDALYNLVKLLWSLTTGVNLLVYVVKKGRITITMENNYKLFVEKICKSQVPVILVVTGCDFAKDKQWAKDNQKEFENNGMKFEEHLSVCAKKSGWDEDEVNVSSIISRYAESEKNLYHSIESHILPNGWKWIYHDFKTFIMYIKGGDFSYDSNPFTSYIKEIVTLIAEIMVKSDVGKAVVEGVKLVWKYFKCLID